MKRTFIAIDIPLSPEIKELTGKLQKESNGIQAKWVSLHQMHITLAFLGDTTPEQEHKIISGLTSLLADEKPFTLVIKGLGVFKSLKNPQVLWMGVEPPPSLPDIVTGIQKLTVNAGFTPEDRPFKPHLTLARIKGTMFRHNLAELIQTYGTQINETIKINAIIYYESTLTPAGPVYKPIQKYELKS